MPTFDTLITGARVIDGTGNPYFYGDIALSGERISAVTHPGQIAREQCRSIVNGSGKVVCPGFIDIQSHSILPLMVDGRCLSKITQGVTTEIMGEGWTPAPAGGRISDPYTASLVSFDVGEWRERMKTWFRFGDWMDAMMDHGVSPNVGSFVGGGTLRAHAKGFEMGPANEDELATMRRIMTESMEDGAVGVAYALIYPPDTYVDTAEIVEVCKVVSQYNGVYVSHLRSEAEEFHAAVDETIEIGRRAGCPVEIYHLKAAGEPNWHKMPSIIEKISQARADGLDISANMYPYNASGTGLAAMLPNWVSADGKFFANLSDPSLRRRIQEEMNNPDALQMAAQPDVVMPIGFEKPENQQYVGKRLTEIAEMRNQHWTQATIELLLDEEQRIGTIYFKISEENIRLQLPQQWIKISSDAGGFDPAWAKPRGPVHPRSYGTYPRVLGKYVRALRVITLEDAIRKMSSAVAERLGLRERGYLRTGYYADVVLFDPETVIDKATYEESHQLSIGITDVWINGTRVLDTGNHTGATPGQVVRGPGK